MGNIRLRTKFLLSLLAISSGLTAATLLIVSYTVQKRVRENLQEDLGNSIATYQTFEKQRNGALRTSAALLANLPNVRALMTTEDAATIQDASADVWKLSGSDLLVLANRAGSVAALRTSNAGLEPGDGSGVVAPLARSRRIARLVVCRRPFVRSMDSADLFWHAFPEYDHWTPGLGS